MMADARTDILARVREALGRPTDPRVRERSDAGAAFRSDPMAARRWLPPVPEDLLGRIASFADRSAILQTRFETVPSAAAAAVLLKRIAEGEGWSRIGLHAAPLLGEVLAELPDLPRFVVGEDPFDKRELARCDVGFTTCECLIAQTGSVLVTSEHGGRALSVLPEHHVVIATVDDLVPDLPAAWAGLQARGRDHGFASLITGPSRTGDIERVLVLGAHGPKRLTVVLVGVASTSSST